MSDSHDHEPRSAAATFDAIGARYERAFAHLPEQLAALDWLRRQLPAGARVLDVGSGSGVPTARVLADAGLVVTGIDVAPAMVELARRQVPAATFERADVRSFAGGARGWDAVCAFFCLLQMTRADIDAALGRMAGWLRPGGILVAATVAADVENLRVRFLGQPVEVSSYAADDFVAHVRGAGFAIVHSQTSSFRPDDPEAEVEPHVFVYAVRS